MTVAADPSILRLIFSRSRGLSCKRAGRLSTKGQGHMITISGTVLVNRPRRAVFDFVGDYRNDPKWHTGIQEMRIDPPDEIRVVVRTQDFNRRMRRDLDRLKTIIESAEP